MLPLSDKSLQILSLKHPEAQQAHYEAILKSPKRKTHSIVYENIYEAATKTKGGCGPSGLDADNLRRILVSINLAPASRIFEHP